MGHTDNKGKWLYWAALAFMALGLLAALIALIAPLGIWTGLWDFRTGFSVLGFIVPHAGWVAVLALVAGVALALLAGLWHTGNLGTVLALPLIGALASAIAWYIPNSFQAPEGQSYPPIHDISTDTDNPPRFVDVLPLRADAANTAEYGRSEGMTPARLAQLQREAYPDIQPLTLDQGAREVFDHALAVVEDLGWDLVASDAAAGRIEATDTTFWFRFKDDVVIRIQPQGSGSRVDARSVSRVGRGDVGTNAKRLRAFLDALEERAGGD